MLEKDEAGEELVFSDGNEIETDYDTYRIIELEEALRVIMLMSSCIVGQDSQELYEFAKKSLRGVLRHERKK